MGSSAVEIAKIGCMLGKAERCSIVMQVLQKWLMRVVPPGVNRHVLAGLGQIGAVPES